MRPRRSFEEEQGVPGIPSAVPPEAGPYTLPRYLMSIDECRRVKATPRRTEACEMSVNLICQITGADVLSQWESCFDDDRSGGSSADLSR